MTKEEILSPGMKFGRLTVIEYVGKAKSKHSLWRCKCDCGEERVVRRGPLTTGVTVSCGCYRRQMEVGKTHGASKSRLYNIWNQVRHRCLNKKNISFNNYGGRGIKVCNDWSDFEKFQTWALNNGYSKEFVIDRIDTNGDYTPENCRWITQKENSNNKRNNRYLTIDGITKTVKQWAEKSGMCYETLLERVNRGITEPEMLFDRKSYSYARNRNELGRFTS
jgi:hypothetical protein